MNLHLHPGGLRAPGGAEAQAWASKSAGMLVSLGAMTPAEGKLVAKWSPAFPEKLDVRAFLEASGYGMPTTTDVEGYDASSPLHVIAMRLYEIMGTDPSVSPDDLAAIRASWPAWVAASEGRLAEIIKDIQGERPSPPPNRAARRAARRARGGVE